MSSSFFFCPFADLKLIFTLGIMLMIYILCRHTANKLIEKVIRRRNYIRNGGLEFEALLADQIRDGTFKIFTYDEIRRATNNFSEENLIR